MTTYGYDRYDINPGSSFPNLYGLPLLSQYGVEPFRATPANYTTIILNWTQPQGTALSYRLLSNRYGFPVDQNDGDILMQSSTYFGSSYADLNVIPGTYHYYGIYIENLPNIWIRAGFASCLSPVNYSSGAWLYSLLPEYFRTINDNELTTDAIGNAYLQQFLNVAGWGLDYLKTQYNVLFNHLNSPLAIPLGDLMNLAEQIGMPFAPELPTATLRKAVADWAHVCQERGTPTGIDNHIDLLSGYNVDLQQGKNLMLENDQSCFTDPVQETWNISIGYAVNEMVSYGNYIYKCIALGNLGNAPTGTTSANTWWQVVQNVDDPRSTLANPATLGGVNTWEAIYPALENGTFLAPVGTLVNGIGIESPASSALWNTNDIRVYNKQVTAQDVMLRSVSRLSTDVTPANSAILAPDKLQPIKDGIPVPFASPSLNAWLPSVRYDTGAIVSYGGIPFIASRASTNAPPPSPGTPLNANSSFESGVTPWTGHNGATVAQSSAFAFQGTHSMLLTPNGTTANPFALTEVIPVIPLATYTASSWVYIPAGFGAVQIIANWFDSLGQYIFSSSGSTVSVAAATWTAITLQTTAPPNAATVQVIPQLTGTPASSVVSYWDLAQLSCSGTPEWSVLSTDNRIRLLSSAYTSQSLTVGTNQTVPVVPYVEWYDSWGQIITSNGQSRLFARTPTPGTPGTPANLSYDSFTLGIGSFLNGRQMDTSDQSWATQTGAFLISGFSGGSVYPAVVGQRSISVVTGLAGTSGANCFLGVTFASGATTGQSQGLLFRYVSLTSYWRATRTGLYLANGGAPALIGTYSTPFQDGDRMNVLLNGTTITVYRNGVQVYTTTGQTVNQTATLHGMVVENT